MQFLSAGSFAFLGLALAAAPTAVLAAAADTGGMHDLILRNGTIYDGSGKTPYAGEIAIDADRITYVGPPRKLSARTEIDVKGQAIAPGFINMLAHPDDPPFA